MKNILFYLTISFVVYLGFWISLTWDIPVDNQIGTFFFTCMLLLLLITMIVYDIRQRFKKKQNTELN
jgi:tetrahydromethanopterin S-methyltransferase subunit E